MERPAAHGPSSSAPCLPCPSLPCMMLLLSCGLGRSQGVPAARQKLMARGAWKGILKDDVNLAECSIKEGQQVRRDGVVLFQARGVPSRMWWGGPRASQETAERCGIVDGPCSAPCHRAPRVGACCSCALPGSWSYRFARGPSLA